MNLDDLLKEYENRIRQKHLPKFYDFIRDLRTDLAAAALVQTKGNMDAGARLLNISEGTINFWLDARLTKGKSIDSERLQIIRKHYKDEKKLNTEIISQEKGKRRSNSLMD